jgi:hypothetical protein
MMEALFFVALLLAPVWGPGVLVGVVLAGMYWLAIARTAGALIMGRRQ